MYSSILANINKFITFTKEEQDILYNILQSKKIDKKTIVLREGEICKFEYYIVKGCTRVFYVNESGVEVTVQFGIEDWWVSDICSFVEQTPSRMFIETLEDCDVLFLTPKSKEELLQRIPKLERYFRLLVQKHMVALQNRVVDTITLSATARYLAFINTYPTILNRVPQYYIASYLGISAEFISKIRKRLAAE